VDEVNAPPGATIYKGDTWSLPSGLCLSDHGHQGDGLQRRRRRRMTGEAIDRLWSDRRWALDATRILGTKSGRRCGLGHGVFVLIWLRVVRIEQLNLLSQAED